MLTDEEKIQRAKEIYYRRNGISYRGEEEKKQRNSPLKMFIIIILIGVSVYAYENKEKLFTQETYKEVKDFLNTKIDINSLLTRKEIKENKIENKTIENTEIEAQENEVIPNDTIQNYSIIWPVKGTITSNFGKRESSDARVGSNHTGIDISGNERG